MQSVHRTVRSRPGTAVVAVKAVESNLNVLSITGALSRRPQSQGGSHGQDGLDAMFARRQNPREDSHSLPVTNDSPEPDDDHQQRHRPREGRRRVFNATDDPTTVIEERGAI